MLDCVDFWSDAYLGVRTFLLEWQSGHDGFYGAWIFYPPSPYLLKYPIGVTSALMLHCWFAYSLCIQNELMFFGLSRFDL